MTEVIRTVGPDEASRLTEIGELTALAYLADGLIDVADPYMPLLKDAQARAEHASLLIMADGHEGRGPVVGTLTVVPPGSPFSELAGPDEFELRMLAVSPIERGRGIGSKLTLHGMEMAGQQGAKRVVLSTMETMHVAHRLYERLGFQRREDLDWYVIDNHDGVLTKQPAQAQPRESGDRAPGVRLLGYSWDVQ